MSRCLDPKCSDGPPLDCTCDPDAVPHHHAPGPRLTDDGDRLCRRCADLLEKRIAELPARQRELRDNLGGLHSHERGENRPTKGTPPVPLNIAAHDHLTDMHAKVVSWVRMVAEERDLRGPDRDALTYLCPWLLSQLPYLLQHGAVGDLADEMRDLTRTADFLSRSRTQWHPVKTPCDTCGHRRLGRWDGDEGLTCQECGDHYDDAAHLAIALRWARNSEALLDRAAAAKALDVTRAHLRQLIRRGHLKPVGVVDEEPRYDVNDVLALRVKLLAGQLRDTA